jgi:hypothetical protein
LIPISDATFGRNLPKYITVLFELHNKHSIRHIYLGSRLIASEKNPFDAPKNITTAYYLYDHQGTILLATDEVGTTILIQRYTPFGNVMDSSTLLDRYLGKELDIETGLLHLGEIDDLSTRGAPSPC